MRMLRWMCGVQCQERDDTTVSMKRGGKESELVYQNEMTQWKDTVGRDKEKCWDYRGTYGQQETMGRHH